MARWRLLAACAMVSTSCADILGLGNFNGSDASVDATADVATEATNDAACDPGMVDDTAGIFVLTGSMDTPTCGTETVPCGTVQAGLNRAHQITGKLVVYVARGMYPEAITLYAGLRLEGGWDVLDNGSSKTWVQACTDPSGAAVIQSPGNDSTVTAADLGGTATLATLTIRSKPAASNGESLYGLFATGATTNVVLNDVVVEVAGGGDGSSGDAGAPGDAATGSCNAGDGAAGTPGVLGGGAEAGTFDTTGWITQGGTQGSSGAGGAAGVFVDGGTCVACGTCSGFIGCSFKTDGTMSCGSPGTAGCGGAPGTAGLPGGGGGSSVGIFAWDATITITGGHVTASAGGAGGNGGPGGAGGGGLPGEPGDAGTSCGVACSGCSTANGAGLGGDAGGSGGMGGAGGTAGGGAGGCSYAVYQGGDAGVMLTSSTSLAHGEAGLGGGPDAAPGAPGLAADRFP